MPSSYVDKICELCGTPYVTRTDGRTCSRKCINDLLYAKTGYYWKGSTFREIVNELLREGLVECVDGRGRENKWMRKDMVSDNPSSDVATSGDGSDTWYPF